MTKLLDKKSGKEVEFPAARVKDALASGQFAFSSSRNVPIIQDGEAKWITPTEAARYWKSLDFTDDTTVRTSMAEERFGGMGGAALGLGLGAVKTATLGVAPLALGAVSKTAREAMRDIELGAPTAAGVGEFAGLFVDPFAAFGRRAATRAAGEAGAAALPTTEKFLALPTAAAAQEATAAAEGARLLGRPPIQMPAAPVAEAAAPAAEAALPAARAAYRKPSLRSYGQAPLEGEVAAAEQAVGEAMVEPVVPPRPLSLGGRVASAEPEAGVGFAARDAARQPRGLPPGGREPLVTPTEFEREAVDLSAFRPDERRGLPSAGRELRAEMQEAGKLEPFETAVADEGDLPYRANKQMISDEIDYTLFEKNDLPRDEQRVRAFVDDVRKRTFDIETAIKKKAWMGETPPAVIEMDRFVASRTGAKLTGTSDLKVTMSLREPGQLRRAIEAIEDTDVAAVLEAGMLNDLRFLTKPQEFEVRWNPSRPYGTPAPRASKNADGWIGAIRDKAGNTIDVAKGKRDDVERQLSDALRRYNTDVTKDVMSRLREYGRAIEQLGGERVANIEAARAQLSFADLSLPAVERVVAEPTAMAGRLEFGRGAGEVAAQRAAARQELQLGQLAAEREAQREAIRRGGLPPERVGPEPVGGLVLAGQPERVGIADVVAAEEAARAQAAAAAAARQAPPGGAIMPYPTLPSGAADVGLRDAMVAQREAVNARALPPRGIGVSDVQAAQRAAAEEVMRGRDIAATAELRNAVQADIEAGRYGVPPERGIQPVGPRAMQLGEPVPAAAPELTMPTAEAATAPGAPAAAVGAMFPKAEAAGMESAAGGLRLGKGESMALQGALLGGATQAYREQVGLEEGAPGSILKAAFVGGAIPIGFSALIGGAKAGASQLARAASTDGTPLGRKFAEAMDRFEETAVLNMFGMNKAQIRELNASIGAGINEQRGTRNFVDFVKRSVGDIESLKRQFPDDAMLQSIRLDTKFRLGNLRPEQRVAFSNALRESYGRAIEKAYEPFVTQQIPTSELLRVLRNVRRKLVGAGSLGDIPMQSIRQEYAALENYLMNGGQHTVGSLRQFEKDASRLFRESVGVGNPFTEAQQTFRNAIKDTYLKAVEAGAPGTSASLSILNRAYQMAERLAQGAVSKEATLAARLPVDRAQITQGILGGIGIGRPLDAAKFFVASVAMRGFYNQRGEGFIADLAGRLGTGGVNFVRNPSSAAQVAAQSILDAKRPLLLGFNGEKFSEVEPKTYAELTQAVREVQRQKDAVRAQVYASTSNLPPEEQQRVVAGFDNVMQALIAGQPGEIETGPRLSEAARRYGLLARSMIDHAYGTQLIAQGGRDADVAAAAFKALGPEGQEYIDKVEEDLRMAINQNRKLQEDRYLVQAYQNIKKQSSRGGIRMGGMGRIIHGGLKAPASGKLTLPGTVGATALGRTVNAYSGVSGQQR